MIILFNKALKNLLVGLFLCIVFIACSESVETHSKTLVRGNGSEPETIDPQLVRSESAGNIVRDMYEGLLTEKADGTLELGSAQSMQYDSNTLCHTFFLDPKAKWSNGDAVVATDFKRGFEFALDEKNLSPYSELLKSIESIKISNSQTLSLCLGQPVPYFLELLALPVSYPRHQASTTKSPITNGAYQFDSWTPQDRVILKKNTYFHSVAELYFNKVEFLTTENASSELKRFLAGELDITATVPPADVSRLRETHATELKIAEVLNSYFYGFNLSKAPFKDNKNLRKALSLAVDRNILVNKVLGTGETAAWSLVPPNMSSYAPYKPKYAKWSQAERLKEAKRLYVLAGYSIDKPVKFELRYNTSPLHKKTAIALAAMWKTSLGAEVELYNEEWKVFVQNRRNKNTQMFRSGWIADVNDASNYLELFVSNHPLNDYAYSNSRFDNFIDSDHEDTRKRTARLSHAEQILLQDHAIIPLYYYVSKHMLKQDIQGWQDNLLDHHLSRYLSRKE